MARDSYRGTVVIEYLLWARHCATNSCFHFSSKQISRSFQVSLCFYSCWKSPWLHAVLKLSFYQLIFRYWAHSRYLIALSWLKEWRQRIYYHFLGIIGYLEYRDLRKFQKKLPDHLTSITMKGIIPLHWGKLK